MLQPPHSHRYLYRIILTVTCMGSVSQNSTSPHPICRTFSQQTLLECSDNAPDPWSFTLFSWLPSGLGSWVRTIMQTGFVLLFILFCVIVFQVCTCCLSNLSRNEAPNRMMLTQDFEMFSMLISSTRQELWEMPASSLFYLPCYSHRAFSGFVTMHAPSDMGHDRQERSFRASRDKATKYRKALCF
ncbi:hypothetical protein mRhiFer1_008332 [Rhinolophus ferrumequinum]|uniref:Uncharacterized protein n=1 Tax=Rhinolophus ferrumequinum TaxID=59479 RepID=A0A7J7VDZ0_RHIFE|nr:hypothetical protein mRhiFer1_008332 [Rhinolophus ferrumequinum]